MWCAVMKILVNIFSNLVAKNQKGFNLVEVLFATSLLTVAGVAMLSLSQLANKDSVQLRSTRVALTARSNVEAALKNPAAWRQTVAQNASFACANGGGCLLSAVNSGYYDFILYGAVNGEKVSYDATDPTTRYSIQGGPCPAGYPDPDTRCPIKYRALWKPVCQAYPCTDPTLDIKISLVLDFGSNQPPINAAKYEYDKVRGYNDGSLQSACQVLDGTYNSITGTCYPKNAGKSCAALGKPAQIVSGVAADGSIACSPLYTGQCNPATQVMVGINALGVVQCAPRVQPASCPVACIGSWGVCSVPCGGGLSTYSISTPAANGGAACPFVGGATSACNAFACPPTAVDCVGSWGACTVLCGGGLSTYSITTPAANGGLACGFADGSTTACNTQSCAAPPVNCVGGWGGCSASCGGGLATFIVSTPATNGGLACANNAGDTQPCNTFACPPLPVACVGSWGACSKPCDDGSGPGNSTYSISTPAANGGAACPFASGATQACNTFLCSAPVNCVGAYTPCSVPCGGGQKTYVISTPAANGGTSCPVLNGDVQACNTQLCPIDCVGGWGLCSVPCGGGNMSYSITTPAANGGVTCSNSNGDTQPCNGQACAVVVDCGGSWGACNTTTGLSTFTVTQAPQNGGIACPSPLTQTCPVDCVGSWGSCSGAPAYKTYTWTTPPLNGGAACGYANGATDYPACPVSVDCGGSWGACNTTTGLSTFTITQAPQNGGVACPSPLTQTCPVDCVGSWDSCSGAPAHKTFNWTTPPLNGGVNCAYPNGATDYPSCVVPGRWQIGVFLGWTWDGAGTPDVGPYHPQPHPSCGWYTLITCDTSACTIGDTTVAYTLNANCADLVIRDSLAPVFRCNCVP